MSGVIRGLLWAKLLENNSAASEREKEALRGRFCSWRARCNLIRERRMSREKREEGKSGSRIAKKTRDSKDEEKRRE